MSILDGISLSLETSVVNEMPINALSEKDEENSGLRSRKRKVSVSDISLTKKKAYAKKFRRQWLEKPLFKDWLQELPDFSDRCYCTICDAVLLAGHSELEKHASGKKHCEMMETIKSAKNEKRSIQYEEEQNSNLRNGDSNEEEILGSIEFDGNTEASEFLYEINGKLIKLGLPPNVKEVRAVSPSTLIQASDILTSLPKSQPSILRTKVKAREPNNAFPSEVDPIKIQCIDSDTDDFSDDDMDDSSQVLKEMRTELAYTESKLNKSTVKTPSQQRSGKFKDINVELACESHLEKEVEARLEMINERRRQNHNIYKLKFMEMQARVRLAEADVQRAAEIHNFRINLIKLQQEREGYSVEN